MYEPGTTCDVPDDVAKEWFAIGESPRRDSVRTRHDRRHWRSTDVRDRVNDCG